MATNYVELLDTMIEDINRIVDEVYNDFTIGEYIASLDDDIAEEINENTDIMMAVIKMVANPYIKVQSENSEINILTYAIRRNMKEMAELIEENASIKELVMESYGYNGNFRNEVMDALDSECYEDVVGIMLLEEIINA